MGNNQDTTGSTIYINKGYLHKVKTEDIVIIDNIVIGLVKDVSANKSLVELITSSEMSATVYDLSSPQKTEGLAMGMFGTSIVVERILPGEDIKPGDIIVTSGKDGIFLPGLYIGKVEEVVDDPAQPLKRAFVSTMVDYSKLDKVFVVLGSNDE
jgi:rod shape-determining protein MreC